MISKSEFENLNPEIPNPQSAVRNPQLLQLSGLRINFHTDDGVLGAVDGQF
jgi:hypothetical protein